MRLNGLAFVQWGASWEIARLSWETGELAEVWTSEGWMGVSAHERSRTSELVAFASLRLAKAFAKKRGWL